jgi:putative ABC transport system substrate-binding protein
VDRDREKDMKKKITVPILCAVLLALCLPASAQQTKKLPRIGFLSSGAASNPTSLVAFRQGLRELGYVEGKNIIFEYPMAGESFTRAPARAAELVRLKVDVIVTNGATNTRAAKEATTTIPIVMLQDPDPVGNGFVTNLARPGGNITGFSSLIADLSGKRLELLKEILPKLSRVAVLGNSANAGNGTQLRETERAAEAFKMQLQYLDILGPKDIETAFREANKGRADAVFVLRGPAVINSQPTLLAQLAVKNRLPAAYPQSSYVEAGGLMSYGVSNTDLERRAATYVDKILKGAKPADLPVEQPKKFEFVINLKAAKQIGLTIPPNVLVRADRVIR